MKGHVYINTHLYGNAHTYTQIYIDYFSKLKKPPIINFFNEIEMIVTLYTYMFVWMHVFF